MRYLQREVVAGWELNRVVCRRRRYLIGDRVMITLREAVRSETRRGGDGVERAAGGVAL